MAAEMTFDAVDAAKGASLGDLPEWDLSDLYPSPENPRS